MGPDESPALVVCTDQREPIGVSPRGEQSGRSAGLRPGVARKPVLDEPGPELYEDLPPPSRFHFEFPFLRGRHVYAAAL